MSEKQQWLTRIFIGGPLGGLAYGLLLILALAERGSMITILNIPLDLPNVAAGLALSFALGAACGVATLPFEDAGRALALRSLAHFLFTGAVTLLLGYFALGLTWLPQLLSLAIFYTGLYAVIWLGRWVSWVADVAAIRTRLGLTAGPSPLKWRETLPHLGYAALLCLALPFLLHLADARDLPVLTALLLPYVLLPVGGFFSALSLGRRQGFCPLYPIGCALFYLPAVLLLFRSDPLFHCALVALPALWGNLLGSAMLRRRQAREVDL